MSNHKPNLKIWLVDSRVVPMLIQEWVYIKWIIILLSSVSEAGQFKKQPIIPWLTTVGSLVGVIRTVSPTVTDSLGREAHWRVIATGKLRWLTDGHFTALLVRLVLAVDVSIAHPVLTNAFPYGAEKTNVLQSRIFYNIINSLCGCSTKLSTFCTLFL